MALTEQILNRIVEHNGVVQLEDALQSKWMGTQWTCNLSLYSNLNWLPINSEPKPTEAEINAEIALLQAEYDAQDYARKRKAAYPSLNDFAEAYTEKEFGGDSTKMDAYKIKYEKVRSDNPK